MDQKYFMLYTVDVTWKFIKVLEPSKCVVELYLHGPVSKAGVARLCFNSLGFLYLPFL
jgi:hypothetical protein